MLRARDSLLQLKKEFVKQCEKKERHKLIELSYKHRHFSDHGTSSSPYHDSHWPDYDDVRKARHDHVCQSSKCGKTIKKGSFYFRRSFGRLWTIKACSMKCFCRRLP